MNSLSITARWMPALVLCASAVLSGAGAAHAQTQEDSWFGESASVKMARIEALGRDPLDV